MATRDRPPSHLVFLDLEMTGQAPPPVGTDRIVEIGLWRDATCYETLVDPGRPSCEAALALHGLSEATLNVAPKLHEVAEVFLSHLEDAVIVGHGIEHDRSFLQAEIPHGDWGTRWWIDTRRMAQRCLPTRRHTLTAIAEHLGIPVLTHRALADATTTRDVFWALYDRLQRPSLRRLAERVSSRDGDPSVVPILQSAFQQSRPVLIQYDRGRGGVQREIRIQGFSAGTVRAWCSLRRADRCFRLDRIMSAVLC